MKRLASIILALFLSFAVASPATQTDMEVQEKAISVLIELETPVEEIRYGSPVRLRCVVSGLEKPYYIQWQCSWDAEEWTDLPCMDDLFEFILDEQNIELYYRVIVSQ